MIDMIEKPEKARSKKICYTLTRKCGHSEYKWYVSSSKAQAGIDNAANRLCRECQYIQDRQDGRDEYTHQYNMGLPALSGTDAQVNWAATIRQRYINALTATCQPVKGNSVLLDTKTAQQWIAMRNDDFETDIAQLVARELDESI